jgi:hypothetical protein
MTRDARDWWKPLTEVEMSSHDEEMVIAHFIVSDDVERSARCYIRDP